MNPWKQLPNGIRVKHCLNSYEGWIVGTTECLDGAKVNPDGKTQYRVLFFGDKGEERRRCAEMDLSICNSPGTSGQILERRFTVGVANDLTTSFTVWALGKYHARPELGNPARKLLTFSQIGRQSLQTDPRRPAHSLLHTEMIKKLRDGQVQAVDYFYNQLNAALGENLTVVSIPSHTPNTWNVGLKELVRQLTRATRTDATACLSRFMRITPSHKAEEFGENRRDMNRHIGSIRVENAHPINCKTVLLIDDVVTTGTTFTACRKLLLDSGANKVICLALGSSTW